MEEEDTTTFPDRTLSRSDNTTAEWRDEFTEEDVFMEEDAVTKDGFAPGFVEENSFSEDGGWAHERMDEDRLRRGRRC